MEGVKDEHHFGRQITQGPEENVPKVHYMVLENRKIGIENSIKETGLSTETVHTVLREHLSSKMSAKTNFGAEFFCNKIALPYTSSCHAYCV